MIAISEKYFPAEALAFWNRQFSGIWEEVEQGRYLPIVVVDGENLGTDGDPEEIAKAAQHSKCYLIAGCPRALYIGCQETERSTFLYWKDDEGNYYSEILGVLEMERWFREIQKKKRDH